VVGDSFRVVSLTPATFRVKDAEPRRREARLGERAYSRTLR